MFHLYKINNHYNIVKCEFFFQASENQELLKEQPTETIDAAKSMIQLFPKSKFALEFLAKDFLLSLVNAREGLYIVLSIEIYLSSLF